MSVPRNSLTTGAIESSAPVVSAGTFDFRTEELSPERLSPNAQELFAENNAGGTNVEAEALAFEVLRRADGAQLFESGAEIVYDDSTHALPHLTSLGAGEVLHVTRVRIPRFLLRRGAVLATEPLELGIERDVRTLDAGGFPADAESAAIRTCAFGGP